MDSEAHERRKCKAGDYLYQVMNMGAESDEIQWIINKPGPVVGTYSFGMNTNVLGSFFHFL